MRKHWFGRRRSSYGGVPVTWEGWACVMVLVALVSGAAALLPLPASVPLALLALLVFLLLSVAKGPVHHWRWAGQDD